ncbi:MAG: hypothetical protein BWY63_03837 [Chloroflexi bacterium ADurb.Bin360]|nr:MAG: hypothetical protein BWY63_03837 [Chloroflexi bacterium ADurb.Bin360]
MGVSVSVAVCASKPTAGVVTSAVGDTGAGAANH